MPLENVNHNMVSIYDLYIRLARACQFLITNWLIIIVSCIVGGLVGICIAWLQKPTYIAEMRFVTEDEEGGSLGMYAGIAAQFGIDIGGGGGGAFEGENLIELLQSRMLIEKTLLTPSTPAKGAPLMIDLYLKNNDLYKQIKNNATLKDVKFEPLLTTEDRKRDSIIGKVYKELVKGNIEISKKDKKLNIITLVAKDNNEYFAKRFVELLAHNAIVYYTDYKSKKSKQNVAILQRQTDSVKRMLFGNIGEVAVINDLNVNPIRQTARAGSQRKQVDVQANAVLYGELVKNLELAKIALRRETPLIQIIDSPKFPLEKKKLGRLLTGLIFAFLSGLVTAVVLIVNHELKRQKMKYSAPL